MCLLLAQLFQRSTCLSNFGSARSWAESYDDSINSSKLVNCASVHIIIIFSSIHYHPSIHFLHLTWVQVAMVAGYTGSLRLSSPPMLSCSSWLSQTKWDMRFLQQVLALPRGPLPVGCVWKTFKGRCLGGIPIFFSFFFFFNFHFYFAEQIQSREANGRNRISFPSSRQSMCPSILDELESWVFFN